MGRSIFKLPQLNFGFYKTVKIKKFEASGKKTKSFIRERKFRFVIREQYFKLGMEGREGRENRS